MLRGKAKEKVLVAYLKGLDTPGYTVVEDANGGFTVSRQATPPHTHPIPVSEIVSDNTRADVNTMLNDFAERHEIDVPPPRPPGPRLTRRKFTLR
jgi:hypothetical protein